jgi:hypothetical protein
LERLILTTKIEVDVLVGSFITIMGGVKLGKGNNNHNWSGSKEKLKKRLAIPYRKFKL